MSNAGGGAAAAANRTKINSCLSGRVGVAGSGNVRKVEWSGNAALVGHASWKIPSKLLLSAHRSHGLGLPGLCRTLGFSQVIMGDLPLQSAEL